VNRPNPWATIEANPMKSSVNQDLRATLFGDRTSAGGSTAMGVILNTDGHRELFSSSIRLIGNQHSNVEFHGTMQAM
tara:strand:- start:189 stop:419 length:231 start_codon:yes stop_codon:yes gene_type:complete